MKASKLFSLFAAIGMLAASASQANAANTMPVKSEKEPTYANPIVSFHGGTEGVGVISGQPQVYLVFWGSQWGTSSTDSNGNLNFTNDSSQAAPYLQRLFEDIGVNESVLWSAVVTQYCDGPGIASGGTTCPGNANHIQYPSSGTGVLAGVWYDNASAEPAAATLTQIGQEALRAAAHFGNTNAVANRYVQYVIVSSTGMNPDAFFSTDPVTGGPVYNYCAEHSWNGDPKADVSGKYGDVAFVNLPYVTDAGASCAENAVNAGAAGVDDGFSIVAGHEYAETLTDPVYTGWYSNGTSGEIADECAFTQTGDFRAEDITMGNGDSFAMQGLWSNQDGICEYGLASAITGNGVESAPAAKNGSVSLDEDNSGSGTVSATDSDGDPLIFTVVTKPSHGTLTYDYYAGTFTYTPTSGYVGSDSFTFDAWDGIQYSNTATETLHVDEYFSPPINVAREYMGCVSDSDTYLLTWGPGTGGATPSEYEVDFSDVAGVWESLYSGPNAVTKIVLQPQTTMNLRFREGDGTVWSSYTTYTFDAQACVPIN